MIDWWLATVSGSATHAIDVRVVWHGRVMVLAWSLLVPVALLWARYWKIAPGQDWPRVRDDRRWWNAHRVLQSLAVALTIVAVSLVWRNFDELPATTLHARLGWFVLLASALQILHGLMRGSKGGPTDANARGDHFDMTARRVFFERAHKSLGWIALVVAWLATIFGLTLADAPRWMVAVILLWWILLIFVMMRWQRAGLCIDTYQTIWGTAADLPGMTRKPIGWGVRRYTHELQSIVSSSKQSTKKRHKEAP